MDVAATPFRILAPEQDQSFGRYTSTTVDTSITDAGPTARISAEKSITNPLGIISLGHLAPPSHRIGGSVQDVQATGGAADAIAGLHAIAAEHDVTGINLGSTARHSTFRVGDSGAYINGGTANGLTDAAEDAVHAAAVDVLRQLDVPTS